MGQKGRVCHKAECCLLVLPLPQVRETERKTDNHFAWFGLFFIFFPKGKSLQLVEHRSIKEAMTVYSCAAQIFHLPKRKTLKP